MALEVNGIQSRRGGFGHAPILTGQPSRQGGAGDDWEGTYHGSQLRSEPAMAKVEIYTTGWCPFCRRALALLDDKAVTYTNIDIEEGRGRKRAMGLRSGGRTTVPQIFIDDRHVGGYDELQGLESSGELDALLQA